MIENINFGTDTKEFRNRTIKSLRTVFVQRNVVGASSGIKLFLCTANIELKLNGEFYQTSFNLQPAYNKTCVEQQIKGYTGSLDMATSVTAFENLGVLSLVGADEQRNIFIDLLSSPIVLKNDDFLKITMTVPSTFSAVGNDSLEYYLEVQDGANINPNSIKLPYFAPITSAETRKKIDLGDITSLYILNKGLTNATDLTEFSVDSFNVKSLKFNDEYLKNIAFPRTRLNYSMLENSCVVLSPKKEVVLQDSSITLQVDSAKVATGFDYVCFDRVFFQHELLQKNQERRAKIGQSLLKKFR